MTSTKRAKHAAELPSALLAFSFVVRRSRNRRSRCPAPRRQTPGTFELTAQEVFDLTVQAAQLVARPPLQRFVQTGIEAQQESFAFNHQALRQL